MQQKTSAHNFVIDDLRKSVLECVTHALVTGGPGSGKTTLALLKAKRRIDDGLDPGQSALFLSFSRSAVARILETTKDTIPKQSQRLVVIQTFHSFFWELLRAHGYLLGSKKRLHLLLPHDERAFRDGAADESPEWTTERDRLFVEEGLVSFDVFASKASELLRRCEKLRNLIASRYPLIIVDEAQDTAEDQWMAIKLLAPKTQLICLADLDQQIYDFRPGVTAERVTHIMEVLHPVRADLQADNHRSPDSEIVKFANDILLSTPKGSPYRGVSRIQFRPERARRDAAIRRSVGIVSDKVQRLVGLPPQNIGVFATWGRGVNVITKALTGDGTTNRIGHRVLIDEAPVLLASRLIAFLLEPRRTSEFELQDLADGLELGAAVFRSKGKTANLSQAQRIVEQAGKSRNGESPRIKTAGDVLLKVLRQLRAHSFVGDPRRDWLVARKMLSDSGTGAWKAVGDYAEQLVAFQRGVIIADGLAELWQSQGNYAGARAFLDSALAQDQLLSGGNDLHGIHVMTMHKSKGKEFDAVVILDDGNSCPLNYCQESAPYTRSRKLLRVGITRARHHVLLVTDLFNPSTLLNGHSL